MPIKPLLIRSIDSYVVAFHAETLHRFHYDVNCTIFQRIYISIMQ